MGVGVSLSACVCVCVWGGRWGTSLDVGWGTQSGLGWGVGAVECAALSGETLSWTVPGRLVCKCLEEGQRGRLSGAPRPALWTGPHSTQRAALWTGPHSTQRAALWTGPTSTQRGALWTGPHSTQRAALWTDPPQLPEDQTVERSRMTNSVNQRQGGRQRQGGQRQGGQRQGGLLRCRGSFGPMPTQTPSYIWLDPNQCD